MTDRSLNGLIKFLDYLADKGLMKKNTVSGRKAACSKILGVLDKHETDDVTSLDINDAMNRFQILAGQNYTPQSLAVYKSRLSAALNDFKNYLENPMAFRPSISKRSGQAKSHESAAKKKKNYDIEEKKQTQNARSSNVEEYPANVPILPIPIRPDLVVRVQGLPFDLTEAEANKLASVIKAMAMN